MVRSLLQRNAALATWLTDLGATGLAAAAALARLGTPPSDDLVRALAEAARQFAALRDEVLAAEATIERRHHRPTRSPRRDTSSRYSPRCSRGRSPGTARERRPARTRRR